jgi:uncharacterized protein YjbI with pentapeptide repeats
MKGDTMSRRIRVYSGGNFAGQDLSDEDLSSEDLRGANFTGAKLDRAKLNKCKIDGAIFIDASMLDATLNQADGVANFARAKLDQAKIESAALENSWFEHASLIGAKINSSLGYATFRGANLEGADLSHSNFECANFNGANLARADLKATRFSHVEIIGTDLRGASLLHATIQGADFRNAKTAGMALVPFEAPQTDERPIKPAKAINKITVYRAYQALLDQIWHGRLLNQTHPDGEFNASGEWRPSARENQAGSATATRNPGRSKESRLNFYTRCRSKIHCRNLILAAFDGREVPPDVASVLTNGIEILQTKILASEDLARAILLIFENADTRKAYEV